MLDLIDEPDLFDRLSELDHGLNDGEPIAYVPPPRLTDRLLIPVPGATERWRSNCFDGPTAPRAETNEAFDGLDEGLLESASVPTAKPVTRREAADRPRMHHVAMPGPRRRKASGKFVWVLALYLVGTMLGSAMGAAGASLLFRDQLVAVMDRIDGNTGSVMAFSLLPPRPPSPPTARR